MPSSLLQEIPEKRIVRRRGLTGWHAERTFVCRDHQAIQEATTLYGEQFPNLSYAGRPLCYDYVIRWCPYGIPGLAMITAMYNSPGAEVLPAGRARLRTIIKVEKSTLLRDANGQVIQGQDLDDPRNEWRVIDGYHSMMVAHCLYVIDGYIRRGQVPYDKIADNANKTNKAAFTKPKALVNQLRFLGAHIDEQLVSDTVHCLFYVEYLKIGWDKASRSAIGARVLKHLPTVGTGPDDSSELQTHERTVSMWLPKRKWVGNNLDPAGSSSYRYNTICEKGDLGFLKQISIVN